MYKIRGYVKETGNVHDFSDYKVVSANDIEVYSTTGKTYKLNDLEYLIIPAREFKNVFESSSTKKREKSVVKTPDNGIVETAVIE